MFSPFRFHDHDLDSSDQTLTISSESRQAENLQAPASCLLLASAVAPWLLGATLRFPLLIWLGLIPLPLAFLLLRLSRPIPRIQNWLLALVTSLLLCVIFWAIQPDPQAATPQATEYLAYIANNFPGVILQGWSRGATLVLTVCVLLGLIAAAELAANTRFRRRLYLILGGNGLLIATLALSERLFGVGTPPWVTIASHRETYNICFFHHNFPGATLNLAWPLLLFCSTCSPTGWRRLGFVSLVIGLVAAALPLWHSRTALALALCLATAAFIWSLLPASRRPPPRLLALLAAATLLGVQAWQLHLIKRLDRTHPDGWANAATALHEAPIREGTFKVLMAKRRDRLVPSSAPAREVAWRTAVRMAADYPVLGLGPGAWTARATLYSHDSLIHSFHQHRRFAQNDLLQTAAEWGGAPTILWILLWGVALKRSTRLVLIGEGGLFLALFALALGSLVYFPLQNPAIQVWTALLLGVALGANQIQAQTDKPQ